MDIREFIQRHVRNRAEHIRDDSDLFQELRLGGADCDDFMNEFGKAFHVDLSAFLWYFHYEEEPHSGIVFAWLFLPPNMRVARIPIAPDGLLAAANAGTWTIDYPAHAIPRRRYDVVAANAATALIVLVILILGAFKIFT
jgi:hypothetical protein